MQQNFKAMTAQQAARWGRLADQIARQGRSKNVEKQNKIQCKRNDIRLNHIKIGGEE